MWVVLGVILLLLIVVTAFYSGVKPMAWSNKMSYVNISSKAEWIAPNYLMAVCWHRENTFHISVDQLATAPYHLTVQKLQRYQKILALDIPKYIDILNADHDYSLHNPYLTRIVEDAALAHIMMYDKHSQLWKMEAFIQQLPAGWRRNAHHSKLLSAFTPVNGCTFGRDH
jgi:hypothetical protein